MYCYLISQIYKPRTLLQTEIYTVNRVSTLTKKQFALIHGRTKLTRRSNVSVWEVVFVFDKLKNKWGGPGGPADLKTEPQQGSPILYTGSGKWNILATPRFKFSCTKKNMFLTLWGRAGPWPSHCKSPCMRPPQWSFLPLGPPAQSCWTGSCRAEGSDQAAPPSPSWCMTSQSLEIHNTVTAYNSKYGGGNTQSNVKISIVTIV